MRRTTSKKFVENKSFRPSYCLGLNADLDKSRQFCSMARQFLEHSEGKELLGSKAQQSLFLTLLDSSLYAKIEEGLVYKPDAKWEDLVKMVESIFSDQNPVAIRRIEAVTATNSPTESFTDYLTRFKIGLRNSQVSDLSIEQLCCYLAIGSCKNLRVKEKLVEIEEKDMSLQKLTEVSQKIQHLLMEVNGKADTARKVDNGQNYDKSEKICFCCLVKGHLSRDCRTRPRLRCKECSQDHKNSKSPFCPKFVEIPGGPKKMPPRKKKQDASARKVEESKEEGTKATTFTLNCSEEQRAKLAAAILQNGENNQDDSWAGRVLSYDYQEEIFYSDTEDPEGESDGESGLDEFGSIEGGEPGMSTF